MEQSKVHAGVTTPRDKLTTVYSQSGTMGVCVQPLTDALDVAFAPSDVDTTHAGAMRKASNLGAKNAENLKNIATLQITITKNTLTYPEYE